MSNIKVTICIPTFNGEKYLRECLGSAILQTYPRIEIIIVDDNSTDNTIPIIQEYLRKDSRIKLFINEKNLGLVANWNRCIEHVNGEWIKYLFQDDLLHPQCIERMVSATNNNCKLIVCDREFIFENDASKEIRSEYNIKINTLRKLFKIDEPTLISAKRIIKVVSNSTNTNFIGEPTVVMFRKELFNVIGGFNLLLVQICDLEYWLRISTNYGLFYIPETLVSFRVHGQSMTASNRHARMDLVDKLVLCYDLLYSDIYNNFRQHLSKGKLNKIREMFKLRIYETQLFLKKNPDNSELFKQYEKIQEAIPIILKYKVPLLTTKLIYAFVKIRRKIRN
jgi:glycosyltransferase involved in cell wall biosynthesis